MSRLNAGAFEFVPGKAFRIPPPAQQPSPPLKPVERPEQTEAPAPAPTISLNIGGSKPPSAPSQAPSTPSSAPSPTPAPSAKAPSKPAATASSSASTPAKTSGISSPALAPASTSRTFTLEKAKTDTAAIAQEVQNAADEAVLQDLFGDGQCSTPSLLSVDLIILLYSQRASKYCLCWSCRCRQEHNGG